MTTEQLEDCIRKTKFKLQTHETELYYKRLEAMSEEDRALVQEMRGVGAAWKSLVNDIEATT